METMLWVNLRDRWVNFSADLSNRGVQLLVRCLVAFTHVLYWNGRWMQLNEDEGNGPGGFAATPFAG